MSKLYKRGKYYWYTRGDGVTRVRKSTLATSRSLAEYVRKDWDKKYTLRDHGIYVTPTDLTLKRMIIEWRKFVQPLKSESWFKRMSQSLKIFEEYTGEIQIVEIDTRMINEFLRKRLEDEKRAPNTIHNGMKAIQQLFNYAVDNKYIQENPAKKVMLPKAEPIKPREAIPNNILQKVFREAREDDKTYWMVCYYTGLSASDAGNLIKKDIKDYVIYTVRGKTKVTVPIPLHPKIIALGVKIYRCMPESNDQINSNKRFKKLLEKHKVDGVVHSIRHSFVSHLFDLGLSLDDIKVVAGHTKANMTRSYTHPQLERIREASGNLE